VCVCVCVYPKFGPVRWSEITFKRTSEPHLPWHQFLQLLITPTVLVTLLTTSLTFNNATFCPHSVFMCSAWIREQTAIISLYNIKWLVLDAFGKLRKATISFVMCWITKATDIHSEYVIFTAFLRPQWLRERPPECYVIRTLPIFLHMRLFTARYGLHL
jgi:hypothetical protein